MLKIKPFLTIIWFFLVSTLLMACSENIKPAEVADYNTPGARLDQILEWRGDTVKARDKYRHPKETMEFCEVSTGIRFAELLPGHGWYTQILAALAGKDGAAFGIYYNADTWSRFGVYDEAEVKRRVEHVADFAPMVAEFNGTDGVEADSFTISDIDERLNGTLDYVFFIRALHAMHYFETKTGTETLSNLMARVNALLKPGGRICVVQHRAQPEVDDDWASGRAGYLKEETVITFFEKSGFEFVAKSEINANPKDRPAEKDVVWRLPPSLRIDESRKEEFTEIGESDRMTMLFRKPE